MQDSLFNTVQKFRQEQKINVEELEAILDTDIEDVVKMCKKACLKPKTDEIGNAYFTKNDVDVLKKMKELFAQAQNIQKQNSEISMIPKEEPQPSQNEQEELSNPNKKINFLTRAKNRLHALPAKDETMTFALQKFEDNLVERITDILSEKMDGFDEIVVELIRSKTENENLRQKVDELNKQVFNLRKQLASYVPLPLGLYTKRDIDEI